MSGLISQFDLCTGCGICMLVCAEVNEEAYNPRYARLKISKMEDNIFLEPLVCNQCTNPACERVCPESAIYRKTVEIKGTGLRVSVVCIDQDSCKGCGLCQEYCPRGVIIMKDKKAQKCELCQGNPACVKYCPSGALKLFQERSLKDA